MFQDRKQAGRFLALKLQQYKHKKNVLILGIPRGGVEVAAEMSRELQLPLDIIVVKKIGFPGNEELAIGATGLQEYILNEDLTARVPASYLQEQIKQKQREVKERYILLRGKRSLYSVKGKTVIVVDDGIATGATVKMAVQLLRQQKAKKIIVAIPVGPAESVQQLKKLADGVICLEQPTLFYAIGEFYRSFEQVEEEEVKRLLKEVLKNE